MKTLLLKSIPHFAAVVVYTTVALWYFSPYQDDYELEQGDISHFLGMSKEILDYEHLTGDHSEWTNQIFGGMPGTQISPSSQGNWMKFVDRVLKLGMNRPSGIIFMCMLGLYILGLCMKINPWVCMIGGVAFGLVSFNFLYIEAGHMSKVNAVAYMAPVLGGFLLTLRGKYWLGGAVTALFLALHLTANHLQMTYYLVFLLLFAGIAEAIKMLMAKQSKQLLVGSAVLIGAAILAFLPSSSTIINTYQYSEHTTRGTGELTIAANGEEKESVDEGLDPDYILEYSMGRGEVWSLMIPNVKGGATNYVGDAAKDLDINDEFLEQLMSYAPTYWGRQSYTGGAFYFGCIIVLLFALGMVIVKDHMKWGLLAIALISIVLSWRDPTALTHFFIDSVPGFGKFRDTKMMLVLVQIIMPLVAMMGLDRIVRERKNLAPLFKPVMITVGAVGVILLFFTASPDTFFAFERDQDQAHFESILVNGGINNPDQVRTASMDAVDELVSYRVGVFKADALRSLLFCLAAIALLFGTMKKWVDYRILIPALGLLMFWDLVSVDLRYLNKDKVDRKTADRYPNKKAGEYISYTKASQKYYPYAPGIADMQILDKEKVRYDNFEDVSEKIYESRIGTFEKTPKNKDLIKTVSDFGALGLLSNYRVFTLISNGNPMNPTQDARTPFFHKSIGGYHGAKLMRFQHLLTYNVSFETNSFINNFNTLGPSAAFDSTQVLNMFNMRYIIADESRPAIFNPAANGNCWFVNEVLPVSSADDEIASLRYFNSKTQAVIHDDFADLLPSKVQVDSSGYISLENYSPERVTYLSSATTDQVAVFSEMWYPEGWEAYIDGESVDHYRANYALRALTVPAGGHEIEFVYRPTSLAGLGVVGSVLLLMVVLGGLYREVLMIKEEEPA
jgi:hypothetical protein